VSYAIENRANFLSLMKS